MVLDLDWKTPKVEVDLEYRGHIIASTMAHDPESLLTLQAGSLSSAAADITETGWTADVVVHAPVGLVPTHEAEPLHPMNGVRANLYLVDESNRSHREPLGTVVVDTGRLAESVAGRVYEMSFTGLDVLFELYVPTEATRVWIGQSNLAAAILAGFIDDSFRWVSPLDNLTRYTNQSTGEPYGSPRIIYRPQAIAFEPIGTSIREMLDPLGWMPIFDRYGVFRILTPCTIGGTFSVNDATMIDSTRELTAGAIVGVRVETDPIDQNGPRAESTSLGFIDSPAQVAPMFRNVEFPRSSTDGVGTIEEVDIKGSVVGAGVTAARFFPRSILHPDRVTFQPVGPHIYNLGDVGWISGADISADAGYRVVGTNWVWSDNGRSPVTVVETQKTQPL